MLWDGFVRTAYMKDFERITVDFNLSSKVHLCLRMLFGTDWLMNVLLRRNLVVKDSRVRKVFIRGNPCNKFAELRHIRRFSGDSTYNIYIQIFYSS